MPARLRYQACDETMCYIADDAPTTSGRSRSCADRGRRRQHADVFKAIAFGTRRSARRSAGGARRPRAIGAGARAAGRQPGDELAARSTASTIMGTTVGYLARRRFPRPSSTTPRTGVANEGLFEGRGPLAILLIVLLGGLALNLTPCVLPMIPINLAIIGAGAQAGSRSRGFLLGAAYGAAMALVYGVLGLIVILTAGTFGTINASPWFNLGDRRAVRRARRWRCSTSSTIDFSRFSSGFQVGESSRGIVSCSRSAWARVAALLAGACVAPVVIQVVLFSSNLYATGTPAALALPFFLGVGMAIPWPIAGAGIAALPKPGRLDGPRQAGLRRRHSGDGRCTTATRPTASSRTAGSTPTEVSSSVEEKLKAGWHASLAEGLAAADARRQAGADRHVGDLVQELPRDGPDHARRSGRQRRAEQLREDQVPGRRSRRPAVAAVMQHFNAVGLPTYVIIKPR